MIRKILATLLLALPLLVFTPAYGGWKEKIAGNQIRVAEYITKLQKGANPDRLERPKLRRDKKSGAKVANRELREAMDSAEKLARAGKHKKIKDPKFKNQLLSPQKYKELEKSIAEGKR